MTLPQMGSPSLTKLTPLIRSETTSKTNSPRSEWETQSTLDTGGQDKVQLTEKQDLCASQGGITCGAIDEPRKSSKAIDERVIINFRDKNVVIARFRDKNVVIELFRDNDNGNGKYI